MADEKENPTTITINDRLKVKGRRIALGNLSLGIRMALEAYDDGKEDFHKVSGDKDKPTARED